MLTQMTAVALLIILGFYLGLGVLVSIIHILACGVDVEAAIKNNNPTEVLRARAELFRNIQVTWTWPVDLVRAIVHGGRMFLQGVRVLVKKP